jgi:hypothetical protein
VHARHSNASRSSKLHQRVLVIFLKATIHIWLGTITSSQSRRCFLTAHRTMLSYPLCPFFVVFCNVVGTSNESDFQLLQAVTDGISALVSENKYVNRLHRLCSTLLSLCAPLVKTSDQQDRSNTNAAVPGFSAYTSTHSSSLSSMNNTPDLLSVAPGAEGSNTDGFLASTWNDDMMWQLFQSQPSLDWFNADILDPMWDLNVPK